MFNGVTYLYGQQSPRKRCTKYTCINKEARKGTGSPAITNKPALIMEKRAKLRGTGRVLIE